MRQISAKFQTIEMPPEFPPMKRTLAILVIAAGQAILVLLLARVVRMHYIGVLDSDAFVFGLSAVLGFAGYLRFAFKDASSIKRRVTCVLAALSLSLIGDIASVLVISTTDKWLSKFYIAQMQPRLHSDPHFSKIRLTGVSYDFVLFPYIPVSGSVATEEDRRDLLHVLHQANPLAQNEGEMIFVGNAPPSGPEFIRRVHEDDKVE